MAVSEDSRKPPKKATPKKMRQMYGVDIPAEMVDEIILVSIREKVQVNIKATIHKDGKLYNELLFSHKEKPFLEWLYYLFETKVCPQESFVLLD